MTHLRVYTKEINNCRECPNYEGYHDENGSWSTVWVEKCRATGKPASGSSIPDHCPLPLGAPASVTDKSGTGWSCDPADPQDD